MDNAEVYLLYRRITLLFLIACYIIGAYKLIDKKTRKHGAIGIAIVVVCSIIYLILPSTIGP